jgi:drug/metabolite transporter (DMT)-like permease
MKSNLRNFMERPRLYDNIDGAGEMFMGLMLLGFALAGYWETQLAESASRWMHGLVLYGVLIPTIALGFWGRKFIKRRLTWPRTGYAVAPGFGNKPWRIMAVVSALAAIGAGLACLLVLSRRHESPTVSRLVMLVTWVLVYAVWVWRMGKGQPWKWMAVAAMAFGLVLIALITPGSVDQLFQPAAVLVGIVWLASGAATLVLYLHGTQQSDSKPE